MELNEYQAKAMVTCTESSHNYSYMSHNLVGEVGELMGLIGKKIRKEEATVHDNMLYINGEDENIKKELGDILWQLSGLCDVLGYKLEDVAQTNLDKLANRKQRGVIVGEGDNR